MIGIVYAAVLLLLSDREIIFDVLFTAVILAALLGLVDESMVNAQAKSRVTEALMLAKTVQADQVAHRAETGRWPAEFGGPLSSHTESPPTLSTFEMAAGAFTFHFSEKAGALSGRKLSFRAAERRDGAGATVVWLCGYASVPHDYVVGADNDTDVPKEMLPAACRA